MAMTRPFTCRTIARPSARLTIASFYVHGLLRFHFILKLTGDAEA